LFPGTSPFRSRWVGVRGREILLRAEAAVAPVLLVLPGVARERQPEPAELAEHRGALLLDRRARRAGIAMDVVDRADAIVVSAARADDEAARIVLLDPLRH